MASFIQRGKTWQYTISNKGKQIRKGGFKTKRAAQAAAAEIESNLLHNKQLSIPQNKPVLFKEYFDEWIKVYKVDIGKNTRARYETSLKTIKEYFQNDHIQDITKRKYQAFLNAYAKTHARESTRKLNTHIRACVYDAIDEGIIQLDFTRKAKIAGETPAKTSEEKHLSYFESKRLVNALLDNLSTPTHYLMLLGIMSGMRFAEMVGLMRKDFNFKTNEIAVNKTWGYTNKMHEGFGPTKNGKHRVIKMDIKTMGIFEDFFEKTPENIHGLVFFSPSSKYKVISNNAVNKALANLLDKINIEKISVHGLRHTHASVLLFKRASIYYVADRLGDDVETVNEYYAHIIKELREQDEKTAVDTFEKMHG